MAQSFKSAFAAARKAGKKAFSWNGKDYNTELKETVRPKARNAATESGPKARPKAATGPMPRPRSSAPATATPAAKAAIASPFSSQNSDFESRRKAREALRKKK